VRQEAPLAEMSLSNQAAFCWSVWQTPGGTFLPARETPDRADLNHYLNGSQNFKCLETLHFFQLNFSVKK